MIRSPVSLFWMTRIRKSIYIAKQNLFAHLKISSIVGSDFCPFSHVVKYNLKHRKLFLFLNLINRKPFQCKSTIVWPQQTRKVVFSSFIQSLPTCLMIAIQFKCKWVLLLFLLHFFFWFDFPGHLLAIFKAPSTDSKVRS